jgi:probable F420-dependent oxidoreductase
MRFGVALGRLNVDLWATVTEAADSLGYDFVSLPEHLVLPETMSGSPTGGDHPPIDPSLPVFDVWVYAGFLAGRTTRIRFGSYVYNLGLRHPFVAARSVATADVVSGGRVDLGLGVGWLAEEWAAAGLDFSTRGRRFEEALEVCRRLWTEPVISHRGEFFDFPAVRFEPKPVQPAIPLVLGGDAPATIRRACRFGAGWVPLRTPVEDLPAAIDRFRGAWSAAGRADGDLRVVRALRQADGPAIDRLAAMGVTDLVVAPWTRSRHAVSALETFAAEHVTRAAGVQTR